MDQRTQELYRAAVDAECYRSFLNKTFQALASTSRTGKVNYAAFARKAGFQSRGFTQEVLTGRKRLTTQSFPKFIKGLGLQGLLRQQFTLLVMKEEPELNADRLGPELIDEQLGQVRERIKAELKIGDREGTVSKFIFKHTHFMAVYAVLGNPKKGACIEEISRRTGLHLAVCERVLEHMVQQNVVEERNGRYYSVNPLLIFHGIKGEHPFRTAYFETLEELKRKAAASFDHPEKLFLHAYFSIDRHRLPELKKRLQETISEFVDEHDNDDGDCVGKLLLGVFT